MLYADDRSVAFIMHEFAVVCECSACVSPTTHRKNHRRSLNLCQSATHLPLPLMPPLPTHPRVAPITRRLVRLEHRLILERSARPALLQHPKPPSLQLPQRSPLLLPPSNLHKAHNLPSHWPAAPLPAQSPLLTLPTNLAPLTPPSLTLPPLRPLARLRQPE